MYVVLALLAAVRLKFSILTVRIARLTMVLCHLLWGRRFFSILENYLL
jgi:hypothetical protein